MGECRLDHSVDDVRKKLEEQQPFLPADLVKGMQQILQQSISQEELNELFHLLKKYDLAEEAVRHSRNEQFRQLLQRLAT
ncbi:MAG: hypothetical protein ACM32O_07830 [Clostridia bacterium]